MGNGRCGSLSVLSSSEVVGVGAAINRAMRHVSRRLLYHDDDAYDDDDDEEEEEEEKEGDGDDEEEKLLRRRQQRRRRQLHAIVAVSSAASPLRPFVVGADAHKDHGNTGSSISSSSSSSSSAEVRTFAGSEGADVWRAYDSVSGAYGRPHSLLLLATNPAWPLPPAASTATTATEDDPDPATPAAMRRSTVRYAAAAASDAASSSAERGKWGSGACVACSAPLPLLVFDSQVWQQRIHSSDDGTSHSSSSSSSYLSSSSSYLSSSSVSASLAYSEDDSEASLGPLDEGYLLQAAIGEWLQRAQKQQEGEQQEASATATVMAMAMESGRRIRRRRRTGVLLVDATADAFHFADRFLWRELPTERVRGGAGALSVVATGTNATQLPAAPSDGGGAFVSGAEALAQLDVDHFYASDLLGRHCSSGSGSDGDGAKCHLETVGAPLKPHIAALAAFDAHKNPKDGGSGSGSGSGSSSNGTGLGGVVSAVRWHAGWSGRGPSDIALGGWSDAITVGAVMLIYDDSLALAELVLEELLRAVHHTLVLVSATPWHGIPRSIRGTLKMLARFQVGERGNDSMRWDGMSE